MRIPLAVLFDAMSVALAESEHMSRDNNVDSKVGRIRELETEMRQLKAYILSMNRRNPSYESGDRSQRVYASILRYCSFLL